MTVKNKITISVVKPVPITTPLHLPAAIFVPENKRFFLSWLTALTSGIGSLCLITETDSPVSKAWSILMVVE